MRWSTSSARPAQTTHMPASKPASVIMQSFIGEILVLVEQAFQPADDFNSCAAGFPACRSDFDGQAGKPAPRPVSLANLGIRQVQVITEVEQTAGANDDAEPFHVL